MLASLDPIMVTSGLEVKFYPIMTLKRALLAIFNKTRNPIALPPLRVPVLSLYLADPVEARATLTMLMHFQA